MTPVIKMKKYISNRQKIYSILFLVFAYGCDTVLLPLCLQDIVSAFSLESASTGSMSSMMSIGGAVALILSLFLQGRLRKNLLLPFAGLLSAVSLFCIGVSPLYYLLIIAFLVLGFGNGFMDTVANSYVVDLAGDTREKFLGMLHGLYSVACLIAPLLLRLILRTGKWRNTYYSISALLLLASILLYFICKEKTADNSSFSETRSVVTEDRLSFSNLKEFLSSHRSLMLMAVFACYCASQNSLVLWVVSYVSVTLKAPAMSAIALSVYWGCSATSRFIIPNIKIPTINKIITSLFAAFIFYMAGTIQNNPVFMILAVGLVGLCNGHIIPSLIGTGASWYPGKSTMVTSSMMLLTFFINTIMPLIMGALAESFGFRVNMLVSASFLPLGAVFALLLSRYLKNSSV